MEEHEWQQYNDMMTDRNETIDESRQELEQVKAERDALAAALREMVGKCPQCGGTGKVNWMRPGNVVPCELCDQARATLALVAADTAGSTQEAA